METDCTKLVGFPLFLGFPNLMLDCAKKYRMCAMGVNEH